MASQMSRAASGAADSGERREIAEIARGVLITSGSIIGAVSVVTLWASRGAQPGDPFLETSRMVFNALLPLTGTWVGTVLAYYFSRKNFEAASQSVERLVSLTLEQRLGQLSLTKEMIPLSRITLYTIPAGKQPTDVPLAEIKAKLGGSITRVPIVNDTGVVQYIVHQSGLYKFIAEQATAGKTVAALTLQDLVDDAELNNWVTNIVYAAESESVADAKKKMEHKKGCQDLVVTKTGTRDEPMLGWMTNVDIGRLSKA